MSPGLINTHDHITFTHNDPYTVGRNARYDHRHEGEVIEYYDRQWAMVCFDGEMIRGMKEHVFAVLRDVIFISNEIIESGRFDLNNPTAITNAVFHILRNARILDVKGNPDLVVCWGGHSISRIEYEYSKKVGYELGLRGLDICTGCGPGAMKGPMKGAAISGQCSA